LLEHGNLFNPLVPNPMMRGALKGSLPLSWVEEGPKLHNYVVFADLTGPYKDSASAVFFFSFSFYSSFFFSKTKNGDFFLLKKAHFICIGKNKPPPPAPFSLSRFFFFSKKTCMLENH
jgi:hypothetical protein